MRVMVTRAEREAARWVAQLRGHGYAAESLPLIEIAPPPDAAALESAWRRLTCFSFLMFVSPNAVEQFFARRPAGMMPPWQRNELSPRLWAPGPGTAEALLAAGVPGAAIDAPIENAPQFDSEALWQQVGAQVRAGDRMLLVRGGDAAGQGSGREWLSSMVVARGASVEAVCAYLRRAPVLDAARMALVRVAASDGSVWIFSSSEAVGNLDRSLPGQRWSAGRAVATHPRIAHALERLGFGVVCLSRPAASDIVAALKSLDDCRACD